MFLCCRWARQGRKTGNRVKVKQTLHPSLPRDTRPRRWPWSSTSSTMADGRSSSVSPLLPPPGQRRMNIGCCCFCHKQDLAVCWKRDTAVRAPMTFSCKPHCRQLFKESVRGVVAVVAYAAKRRERHLGGLCLPLCSDTEPCTHHEQSLDYSSTSRSQSLLFNR